MPAIKRLFQTRYLIIGLGLFVYTCNNTLFSDDRIVNLFTSVANFIGLPKARPEIVHEAQLEATELIALYGYPAENHTLTSVDGYILTHHRIPYGKNGKRNQTAIPVILVHGMNCASTQWFDSGPESLAFILADEGYDVWLVNFRGSAYSNHSTFIRDQKEFWDFTLDDVSTRDVAPLIDFALDKTGSSRVLYIGQSMGTTLMFFLLAEKPEYNQKVAGYIALAPALFLKYPTTMSKILYISPAKLQFIRSVFNIHSMATVSPLVKKLQLIVCPSDNPIICQIGLSMNSGYGPNGPDRARIPIHTTHCNGGLSVKILIHFAQILQSQNLRKFDYGRFENLRRYDSVEPPELSVKNIKVPTILIYGANDAVTTPLSVAITKQKLPNVVESVQLSNPMATHIDFMFAKDAKEMLYDQIVMYLKRFQNNYYPIKV